VNSSPPPGGTGPPGQRLLRPRVQGPSIAATGPNPTHILARSVRCRDPLYCAHFCAQQARNIRTVLNGCGNEDPGQLTIPYRTERLRNLTPGTLNPRVQGSSPWGRTKRAGQRPKIDPWAVHDRSLLTLTAASGCSSWLRKQRLALSAHRNGPPRASSETSGRVRSGSASGPQRCARARRMRNPRVQSSSSRGPGHQSFLEFASEIHAPLPPRAEQAAKNLQIACQRVS
jgi:hypothetical protein